MNDFEAQDLMRRFMRAYNRADRHALAALVTADFEWHQHVGMVPGDAPTGRVLRGVDAVVAEIRWRQTHWRDTVYAHMAIRSAGDLIVQTFTISGIDEHGRPFRSDAVDLYPLRDARIARKDTYWKQLLPVIPDSSA